MKKRILLFITTITLICSFNVSAENYLVSFSKPEKVTTANKSAEKKVKPLSMSFNKIKTTLKLEAPTLSTAVIQETLRVLRCAQKNQVERNRILTIIDYSLPSNKKRLWVFDLAKNKLLFHTYVSHGIKSGTLLSQYFSNKHNSKASSIGVYNTEKAYHGRHGLSLKLYGLDKSFNDNAYNRFIVMHGSWYVNENFIKKYGRPGRSWGCPALPRDLTKSIINTIKGKSLLVIYYPGTEWLTKSKFLNCDGLARHDEKKLQAIIKPIQKEKQIRANILFADINSNNKREVNEPIVAITADQYQNIFNKKAPLKRMLRRQIDNKEYIALSNKEFKMLDNNDNNKLDQADKNGFKKIHLVIPVVKNLRGYWATEMKIISLGKLKSIKLNSGVSVEKDLRIENHTLYFEKKPAVNLKPTRHFIRWLGL